ncbi:hypothetical protein JCM9957A_64540 [Kineosporia succinea]
MTAATPATRKRGKATEISFDPWWDGKERSALQGTGGSGTRQELNVFQPPEAQGAQGSLLSRGR